jgi:hypothetical protein
VEACHANEKCKYRTRAVRKHDVSKDKSEIGDKEVSLNVTLFTSYVFLFGFIPVDIHYLKFGRIETGNVFYENSTTATYKYWKHTRTLTEQKWKNISAS